MDESQEDSVRVHLEGCGDFALEVGQRSEQAGRRTLGRIGCVKSFNFLYESVPNHSDSEDFYRC